MNYEVERYLKDLVLLKVDAIRQKNNNNVRVTERRSQNENKLLEKVRLHSAVIHHLIKLHTSPTTCSPAIA